MKKSFILMLALAFGIMSCNNQQTKPKSEDMDTNPFFTEYTTPYQVPPFDKIKTEHYLPAFKKGMNQQKEEVEAIVKIADPTFENTIAALDYSGELLTNVSSVFFNLKSALTNSEIEAIAKEVSPLLSQHQDDIGLNPDLFKNVKAVFDKKDELNLNTEQMRLLDKVYKRFVRGGANLKAEDQERFRAINKELSLLELKFSENQLAETNAFQMFIENSDDLVGLPQSVIDAAADEAKAAGQEGKWLFTVQKPSMIPFLQYSEKRDLREKILKGYIMRGDNNNENDNKESVQKIVKLRVERAHLLRYESHAAYVLDENMAKTPENVFNFMDQLWEKALPMAKAEVVELQKLIDAEKGGFKLEAWDWWYYAEKLRKAKYDLDEEEMRPYFKLENVIDGAFAVAHNLYGISFNERTDIPTYHPEAHVFEVLNNDNTHLGILYMDFFPRESKRGGAWMTEFRQQSNKDGKDIRPVITVVCNFSKPTGDTPSLLNFDEVETLFHEFGHALHGLLSDCTYPGVAGTNVARDFVELPSQFMENFCSEPEALSLFAKHYQTDEIIPQSLVDKMTASSHFNQGFVAVEYLSAAYLDMDWHTLKEPEMLDVNKFEKESLEKIGLIPEIVVRYRSTYFAHIFSGGYSAGYYSYIWAELLDADAFEAFKENGLFDQATATAFRENVLSKGNTEDPMVLYEKFRGAKPKIEPLLRRKGFIQ
ncbi:MAG: M3 family metallopeptidase [Bacteroidales bacterium]|nr:M3 family metallopeptidase [Bacteroidales bacterium]MCF8457549.1 M3 family metallopeptidase [Bacteroidales bacterium]